MDRELWEKAKPLFAAASELEPEEWPGFLDRHCQGETALRRTLEELLESDRQGGGELGAEDLSEGLELGTTHPFHATWPTAVDPMVGRRLGPYHLRHRLGHGGMGTVYLAERDDEEFHKRVAVKLLKHGTEESEEIIRRFRTERQILAGLDHPSIARLLDGGSTEEGLPYLVMEYVEGSPIDEYCQSRDLAIEERLEIFAKVCEAVEYAHRNLVVHRDLKPANILIAADGSPKLLDFGIAKLLNPNLASESVATLPAAYPMTPAYASPEQVRGEPITTASDVYSLGVLLYLLLAGCPPYRATSRSLVEWERVICDTEPPKLSGAVIDGVKADAVAPKVDRHRLARRLRGDLENIVAMAMRKNPERRYGTARELAADLERHLAGLPVIAAGDSLAYRATKFLRRHRFPLAAAAVLLAAALVFVTALALQHGRLERALDREQVVTGFLIDLFALSDPLSESGETLNVRTILDRGAETLPERFAARPRAEAELLAAMGKIYRNLGFLEPAAPLLERALERRLELLGEDHPGVAESLYELARVDEARGDYAAAETRHRRALKIRRLRLGELDPAVAESLHQLGMMIFFQGRAAEAEDLLRQALALRQRIEPGSPAVAESSSDLAGVLLRDGRLEEAETLLAEAHRIYSERLGDHHPHVATTLNLRGLIARQRGELDEAESHYRTAFDILQQRLGSDHPHAATSLHNLAGVLEARGDAGAAEDLYRRSLAIRRERLGERHEMVANSLFRLGHLHRDRGDVEEARRLYLEAHDILIERLGAEHPLTRQVAARLEY